MVSQWVLQEERNDLSDKPKGGNLEVLYFDQTVETVRNLNGLLSLPPPKKKKVLVEN